MDFNVSETGGDANDELLAGGDDGHRTVFAVRTSHMAYPTQPVSHRCAIPLFRECKNVLRWTIEIWNIESQMGMHEQYDGLTVCLAQPHTVQRTPVVGGISGDRLRHTAGIKVHSNVIHSFAHCSCRHLD